MEGHAIVPTVLPGKKGFTLIEVLVALVVLLLISLAMMQTALLGIDANMINILRDEAVKIADMRMAEARNLPFTETVDSLVTDTSLLSGATCPAGFSATGVLVEREFRNISGFDFCTNRTVNVLDVENKQVNITVGWVWKGESYTHAISTIIKRQ